MKISKHHRKNICSQKEHATTILHYFLSEYAKLPDIMQLEKQSLCKYVCDNILPYVGYTCLQDFLLILFYFKLDNFAMLYINKYPAKYTNHKGCTHIGHAMKYKCFLCLEHLIEAGCIETIEQHEIVSNYVNKFEYCNSIKKMLKAIGKKLLDNINIVDTSVSAK